MCKKSATFMFWDMVIRIQILILQFVKVHQEENFSLYIEALEELMPMFFIMDHVHYSRWAAVHIRDMKSLPTEVKTAFMENGAWVVNKTCNPFSAIPIDECHEQQNKVIKGLGGIVGILDNPSALR